jgi:hypothetical protein
VPAIACPTCKASLDLPPQFLGRQVRCYACANNFQAPPPQEEPIPEVELLPEPERDAEPREPWAFDDSKRRPVLDKPRLPRGAGGSTEGLCLRLCAFLFLLAVLGIWAMAVQIIGSPLVAAIFSVAFMATMGSVALFIYRGAVALDERRGSRWAWVGISMTYLAGVTVLIGGLVSMAMLGHILYGSESAERVPGAASGPLLAMAFAARVVVVRRGRGFGGGGGSGGPDPTLLIVLLFYIAVGIFALVSAIRATHYMNQPRVRRQFEMNDSPDGDRGDQDEYDRRR